MVSGVQTPSQRPEVGQSPEMWACKHLRTKHFHRVSSGNQHPYLLKSRYGKVSYLPVPCLDLGKQRFEGGYLTLPTAKGA